MQLSSCLPQFYSCSHFCCWGHSTVWRGWARFCSDHTQRGQDSVAFPSLLPPTCCCCGPLSRCFLGQAAIYSEIHSVNGPCKPQAEYEELISHLWAMNPAALCHRCSLHPAEECWGSFALERGNVLMNQVAGSQKDLSLLFNKVFYFVTFPSFLISSCAVKSALGYLSHFPSAYEKGL